MVNKAMALMININCLDWLTMISHDWKCHEYRIKHGVSRLFSYSWPRLYLHILLVACLIHMVLMSDPYRSLIKYNFLGIVKWLANICCYPTLMTFRSNWRYSICRRRDVELGTTTITMFSHFVLGRWHQSEFRWNLMYKVASWTRH